MKIGGSTLHHHGDLRFSLFPRQSECAPEFDSGQVLEWMGRFIGRIHAVMPGPFITRPEINIRTFGDEPRDFWRTMAFCLPIWRMSISATFTTEVTSNTALISSRFPSFTPRTSRWSRHAASHAHSHHFVPVMPLCSHSTPPNAIAMSTGEVDVSTMAKFGFILNILGIGLITLIAMFYWRYML